MKRPDTIKSPDGKLAVLLPGMGAVATTTIAGVMLARRGLGVPIGSLTQLGTIRLGKRTENRVPKIKEFVPLAGLDDLVVRLHGAFGASNVDAVYTHWGSAFKAAAHELGLPVGSYARSRPPQPPLPEVQKAAIRSAYGAIGLVQAAS